MVTRTLPIDTIISDSAVRGGRPVIAGTTLCVSDLVAWHLGGMSPEELATQFELGLGEVCAALAYYHLHKEEIEREIRARAEKAETWLGVLKEQGKLISGE
jgi:uncharacterized protein (DUF433 family)